MSFYTREQRALDEAAIGKINEAVCFLEKILAVLCHVHSVSAKFETITRRDGDDAYDVVLPVVRNES
jgi:hypothetical protein